MRYFVPDIRLPAELPAPEAGKITMEEKLGGLPWGLPSARWPKCSDCRKSQSLLAQFGHDSFRLDLGRPGRMLYIFQCNHDPGMCSTWEGGAGANACFVLEPEELIPSLSALPADKPPLEREVRIASWLEHDDGIAPGESSLFFDDKAFEAQPEYVREELFSKVTLGTRLGGVPHWIQGSSETPQGDWRFAGQLDSLYSFYTSPKSTPQGIREDRSRFEGRTHACEGPNFGDAGIGYIFLRNTASLPEGWFFTQCS